MHIENEYLRRYPMGAAEALEAVPANQLPETLAGLDAALLPSAMEYASPQRAVAIFQALSDAQAARLLERASPRLTATIVSQLDASEREKSLAGLSSITRKDIERLMNFPADSAARLMDRSFMGVQPGMRVGEVLERLRETSMRSIRSLFVVTEEARLAGRIDMQDLALATPDEIVSTLCEPVDDVVAPHASRERLVALLERSRRDSVPVVDADGRLLGVVRFPSLFQAIEDVATADLQKMVGASPEERALSSPGFAVKRRLPWLHVNLLTAFLAASVVGLFENLIAQFTALAVLLPVVAGQSGNAGAQALAVTMRGLALQEIGLRQWRAVLRKEILVGMADGIALAITCGLAVYLWSASLGLAIIIGIAMIMSMLAAGIAGALVPIILTRLGQDPATAASILLTTVTDVAGFFAFLGTATALAFML